MRVLSSLEILRTGHKTWNVVAMEIEQIKYAYSIFRQDLIKDSKGIEKVYL